MELRREISAWKELCSAVGAHTAACHVFKSPISVLPYICVCVRYVVGAILTNTAVLFCLPSLQLGEFLGGLLVRLWKMLCLFDFFLYQLCCIPLYYWRYFDMGLHVLIFHCELRWYTQCEWIGGVAYQCRCLFWVCK